MLLILVIVIGILALASGLIGVVGFFFTVGAVAILSRIFRLVFSALAVAFVVLLLLLLF